MKNLEQFFTSEAAANLFVETALAHAQVDIKTVCEPCAGGGALVNALRRRRPEAQVYAYDIDHTLCEQYGWERADFLSVEPIPCDLVICNPPFNSGRGEDTNKKTGRELALFFLLKSFEWAPLVCMIMHQNKGSTLFASKVYKARPDVKLVHYGCIPKKDSVFNVGSKIKFVPCAIYVYRTHQTDVPKPVIHKSTECADFEFLTFNDPSCNLILKRWGSINRIGKVVTKDPGEILEHVQRVRNNKGKHDVNMHLRVVNIEKTLAVLQRMENDILEYFSFARDCSNVSITHAQFVYFYNKHAN